MSKNVIEVNQPDFQREVIQRSFERPVVVDFWAPWCGPCRMLGPVLERLANEDGSRFTLAKVNSDNNQQLSMQFDVRGIPAVKAFVNGRVVNEFVGAQPEQMVRQFVQRLPMPTGKKQAAPKRTAVSGDVSVRMAQARKLLQAGKGCQAQTQLDGVEAAAAGALRPLAQFLCDAEKGTVTDSQLRQVSDAIQRRDYGTAMYNLLIARQGNHKGRADAIMHGLFELLGAENALVQAYQTQLS